MTISITVVNYHFFGCLPIFCNWPPIILQNYCNPSMNYLLFPYFNIAYFGFVLNKSIAFMYSGLLNSLLIFQLSLTFVKKLSVIQSFLVYYRQLFIFIAYCTSFIYRGLFFVAFNSGIFYFYYCLGPLEKNPFFSPPYCYGFLFLLIYF